MARLTIVTLAAAAVLVTLVQVGHMSPSLYTAVMVLYRARTAASSGRSTAP